MSPPESETGGMLSDAVTARDIAAVVSRATGIPVSVRRCNWSYCLLIFSR